MSPGLPPGADWWRRAVFYHLYPRSFQDSDGDGVGDLAGIIERLDYLNDGTPGSLGVDAIWLSPFYPSPQRDMGYDVADFCDVDPAFGNLATLDRLVAACHDRGIRVILDFVPNHTSDQHPWFQESRSSRNSRRRDWYTWRDPAPGGGPPNNWLAVFGGPGWRLDPTTGQYYLHTFLAEQPDLNWRNPEVVEAMHGVLRFWLSRGIDGFRIDALGRVAKDPALADNPPNPGWDGVRAGESQLWLHNRNHPDVFAIARDLRGVLDEFPGRVAVGETFGDDEVLARFYGGRSLDGLHLAFNFHFIERRDFRPVPWSATTLRKVIAGSAEALPAEALPAYAFANHDRPRFISRYDEDGRGMERARAAALLLLGARGAPFIYYGEEIGMRDVEVPAERQRDGARFGYPGRDPARTPMQWDESDGRGFSTAEPWLPHGPLAVSVDRQDRDPASLLNLYRRAAWARRASPALHSGVQRALGDDPDVFLLERTADGVAPVVVAINTAVVPRPATLPAGRWRVLVHTAQAQAGRSARGIDHLPALGAAWYVREV